MGLGLMRSRLALSLASLTAVIVTAIVPGIDDVRAAGSAWKGAESMALVALAPDPDRCGEPPVLEARFVGDGIDSLGGLFVVTASGCIDTDTLHVTDLEATDTFADGSLAIVPDDVVLSLDEATCIATNIEPVGFVLGGGTGRFEQATGSGTYDIALNWPPCNGIAAPARVWFQGELSVPSDASS